MALSDFELHPDRLATTDSEGKRIFLHPSEVRGFFRRRRTWVQWILILFFLTLPWIQIEGRQALLLNIAERRFEIFGLSLRAHNAPLLFLVLAAAAFALFFTTALFGRVWCGWACPQTVFIDGLFRRIEQWTEGSALERRRLDKEPFTAKKFFKRTAKWTLYLLATLVITHSFLAYFVGTENLTEMIFRSPFENWGSFLFMAISTSVILIDFAWFREQFCTIVCPYGRFQSVLMDHKSMIVAYDVQRGEPRATPQAKALAKAHNAKLGDCVNCYRCVQVCPTGIDIRRGLQMECIACTSCMDACDEVMTKLKKTTGLIRYDSLAGLSKKRGRFNLRAGIYLSFFIASIVALTTALALIKPIDVEVLRAKDAPYVSQTLDNGDVMITNHFILELSNQSGKNHELSFRVASEKADEKIDLITALRPLPIADGQVTHADVFVRFSKKVLTNGALKTKLVVESADLITVEKELTLVGPF